MMLQVRRGGLVLGAMIVVAMGALPTIADDGKPSHPKLAAVEPLPPADLEASIRKGVDFLIANQNKDGSWGNARKTKDLNILCPVPGGHQAFRMGSTALCIAGIIESSDTRPTTLAALERAEDALLEQLPHVRRQSGRVMYNCWAHSYGITALLLMRDRAGEDAERIERIDAEIRNQIGMLKRYEMLDGGWGYYNFGGATQKSSGSAISFVAGTGVIALHEAKEAGFELPQGVVDRAIASIGRQRLPDHSYLYGEYLKDSPRRGINTPAGSLGRSQVCNLALRKWGDTRVTDEVVAQWLDRLFARNGWLSVGRKRPVPHESWAGVAGYFYYYGHYYGARCIHELPTDRQAGYKAHMARTITALQEKDGSWWDYPLYNYHHFYGTGMALSTLARCR